MGTICADWQYSSLCWVVKRIQLSWAQGHICCLILFVIVLLSVQLALWLRSWCSFYSGAPTAIGHSFYTLLEAQLYLVPTVWILAWRAFDLFFFFPDIFLAVTSQFVWQRICYTATCVMWRLRAVAPFLMFLLYLVDNLSHPLQERNASCQSKPLKNRFSSESFLLVNIVKLCWSLLSLKKWRCCMHCMSIYSLESIDTWNKKKNCGRYM